MARFLWPALVLVALIGAVVVSAAGEETRTELDYLDEIRGQSTELARSGSMLRDVMSRIAEINREEFTTAFDSINNDLDVAVAFVAAEPPTSSLIPVWSLYRQSVEAWSDGVTGLSVAILQAADDPQDDTVTNFIADALADLRTGDRIYERLNEEFEREEIPEPVAPPAAVQMSPTEAGLLSQAQSYMAGARRSTNELGLRPGLRVSQVVSDPEWELNVEREAVVPTTETIVFSVVITNIGNVASNEETVQLTLDQGAEPVALVEAVPPLRPDGQTTIEFRELQVVPDIVYTLTVELIVSIPDADPNDHRLALDFTVNAP